MASVTKNPLVLKDVNYIYSWFQSKIKNNEHLKLFNALEVVDSDLEQLDYIKRQERIKRYHNFDQRLKELKADESNK